MKNLKEFGFKKITFQMEDSHAFYFDAVGKGDSVEIKVEKENNFASYRKEGKEDWNDLNYLRGGK